MSVEKLSRKKSNDPTQERLREHKATWNDQCTAFIAKINDFKPRLIAFKRGLNGRGDREASLPPSKIEHPLPQEVASFLGHTGAEFNELASTFSKLMSDANSIIREQAEYASNRRKPMPKRHPQAFVPRANLETNNQLIVESSNRVSRLWADLSSMIFPDSLRRERLSALKLAAELFKALVIFEEVILGSGIENIPEVLRTFATVASNVNSLNLALRDLISSNQPGTSTLPKITEEKRPSKNNSPPPPPTSEQKDKTLPDPANFIADDNTPLGALRAHISKMENAGLNLEEASKFKAIYEISYLREKNEEKKSIIEDRLRQIYREIFKSYTTLYKKSSISSEGLEKLSSLSSLYRRFTHWVNPDATTAARVKIFDHLRKMKKHVDEVMDLLENKKFDPGALKRELDQINDNCTQISLTQDKLISLYEVSYHQKDKYRKTHTDVLVDPIEKRLRRNLHRSRW